MDEAKEYHRATLKNYSQKKGYGIVALQDGIAMLRADILWGMGFLEDIEPGVEMQVVLKQTNGGRVVSEIRSFDLETARIDKSSRKVVFLRSAEKRPKPQIDAETEAKIEAEEAGWGRDYRRAKAIGRLATVKWYDHQRGVGVVTLAEGGKAILLSCALKQQGISGIYSGTRMYVLTRYSRDPEVSEILAFANPPPEQAHWEDSDSEGSWTDFELESRMQREAEQSGEFQWAVRVVKDRREYQELKR